MKNWGNQKFFDVFKWYINEKLARFLEISYLIKLFVLLCFEKKSFNLLWKLLLLMKCVIWGLGKLLWGRNVFLIARYSFQIILCSPCVKLLVTRCKNLLFHKIRCYSLKKKCKIAHFPINMWRSQVMDTKRDLRRISKLLTFIERNLQQAICNEWQAKSQKICLNSC